MRTMILPATWVATHAMLVGVLIACWRLRKEPSCFRLFFVVLLVQWSILLAFDYAKYLGVLSVEDYSLFRLIPGRLLPALAIWTFLPCLWYAQHSAKGH